MQKDYLGQMLNNKVILTPIEKIKVEGGDIIKNIKDGDLGYKNFKEKERRSFWYTLGDALCIQTNDPNKNKRLNFYKKKPLFFRDLHKKSPLASMKTMPNTLLYV